MNVENRAKFVKKLLYQSCNRGCKETDLIIGNFAKKCLSTMSDQELKIFENIIHLPDIDIYDWYTNKKPVPPYIASTIMTQILKFDPLN